MVKLWFVVEVESSCRVNILAEVSVETDLRHMIDDDGDNEDHEEGGLR